MKRQYNVNGEKMYKLPYIDDPDLYKAVMGAISWIKKDGYFNVATNYYARRYGVEVDEVRSLIRHAQSVGQRVANERKRRGH